MWSPRQLAELAGTSRRTVRHYDEIGLLPEPDRQSNGYGRYGVDHLVRLLRIRRLTSLGLTLTQIAALGDSQPPASLIRALDAELRGRMEELERSRAELAGMLERAGPVELPTDVARRVAQLPSAERALVVVLSRVLDDVALDAYVGLLHPYRENAAVTTFDDLAEEADRAVRDDLAQALSDHFDRFRSQHTPELEIVSRSLRQGVSKQKTVDEAVRELYNPAQRDVLRRLHAFLPPRDPDPRQGPTSRQRHLRSTVL
ncbi:MerR family transcriptional regulator [Micromonospora ureilytica]|uniref:MerR family transcriptional regulator n=1 Tax=Micromonospora ureilytica TaxID=709868 RepID=UPI0033DB127C